MSDPRTLWFWDVFQLGCFLFPIFPGIGGIILGIVVLGIWKQIYPTLIQNPINRAFALLSVLMLLCAALSADPKEAILGLANFIPYFFVFAAFSWLLQTPQQLKRLAWILVIPSGLVAFLGFGQVGLNWQTAQWWHSMSGWTLEAGGNPPGRMASVFMYANILGFYLMVVLVLGMGLAIETYWAWIEKRYRWQLWQLGVLGVVLGGDAIALLLTKSRNAWALTFVAVLAFAFYLGWRLLVLGVLSCVGVISWASFFPQWGGNHLRKVIPFLLWGRLSGEMYSTPHPAQLRTTQWQFCWELIQQRPWVGWGMRMFNPLYEEATGFWIAHPHNLYIMLAAETGVPVTLGFFALIGWICTQGILWFQNAALSRSDRLIFFSYLLAFILCMGFNLLDVSIFDLRVSTLGWFLVYAIAGVVQAKTSPN